MDRKPSIASSNGGVTAAHLRRAFGTTVGPGSRPGSIYGDRQQSQVDTSAIGFVSNPTPPLDGSLAGSGHERINRSHALHSRSNNGTGISSTTTTSISTSSSAMSQSRPSYSDERAVRSQGQATTPPPALPTELLDALARDPQEHSEFLASQAAAKSMPATLPAIGPHSPFTIHADKSWGTYDGVADSSAVEGRPQKTVHRKKGFMNGPAASGLSTFPGVASGSFVGSEFLHVSPPSQGSTGPRLRKAASAESLRKRAKSGSATNGLAVRPSSKYNQASSNEIKSLWKSLSGRMSGKGKERERNDSTSNLLGKSTSTRMPQMGRTASMDASRRSLSTYPRPSSDHRASVSSSSFSSLHEVTAEASRIPMSSGMVKSRSGPDVYGTASAVPLRSVPLSRKSLSAGPAAQYAMPAASASSSRRTSGLGLEDQLDEEEGEEWEAHQSFTHDLTKRRHLLPPSDRLAAKKASMARMRQPGPSGLQSDVLQDQLDEEDEEDAELSDSETEETSEIASQLSFVDSADLPVDDAEALNPVFSVQGRTGVVRSGTVRRAVPLLTPTSANESARSTLERNRKSSRAVYPAAIKTTPSSPFASPQHSPVSLAPVDRIASNGSRSAGPVKNGIHVDISQKASEATDSGTGMLTPTSVAPVLSPTGSFRTTRPRSFSESATGRAAQEMEALLADTAARPATPRLQTVEEGAGSAGQIHGEESEGKVNTRSRSGSSSNLLRELTAPRKTSAAFVVAIVGPKRVGKSTIIEKNLRLSRSEATVLYEDENGNKVVSYVGVFAVCGVSRTIEILEADMDILKDTEEGLLWPKYLPKLDGAMICYKHGDPRALDDLTRLLRGFWTRGGLALIALATHSPAPDSSLKSPGAASGLGDVERAFEVCNAYGGALVMLDGGIEDPGRKAKNSLQWILRKVLDARSASDSRSPSRAKRSMRTEKGGLSTKQSVAVLKPVSDVTDAIETSAKCADLPPIATSSEAPASAPGSDSPNTLNSKTQSRIKGGQLDIYLTREALVQKYLFAAVTGNDDQHVAIFLIVYRRFARPYDVLDALVQRFRSLREHMTTDPLLSRFAQMKLCNALTRWLELYPGDFMSPATQTLLVQFVDGLFASNWILQYAVELLHLIKHLSRWQDLESVWAIPDKLDVPVGLYATSEAASVLPERRPSLVPSLTSTYSSVSPAPSITTPTYDRESTPLTPTFSADMASQQSGAKSALSLSQRGRSYSDAGTNASSEMSGAGQSAPSLASRESTRKHAQLVEASNLVAETPVDKLAQQVTKVAWDVFARMTPRDLLRYVLAPRDPKNPGAPPIRNENNPVSKAIAYFNMLADWTATMVMVQSKQRHRVRLIEHLIRLATALRELDNYDCLMAILVGLNCQPIHRLNEMDEHVSAQLVKKLKSLNRLMANTRSFAAYRLAIMNARPEMIPYLGAHLQDVTHLNDAKSDMRDGLVNWSKMKAIGKHCAIVIDCARLAPQYPSDHNLSRLITNLPIYSLDDADILYDLSYSYKARAHRKSSATAGTKLRKLLKNTLQPSPAL